MDLEEIVKVDETAVDKTALLQQLVQNLQTHDADTQVSFPTFELAELPSPENARFSPELYQRLARLHAQYDQLVIESNPIPAPAWGERLLAAVKRPFHQLAVFYVNKLRIQQTAVNDDLRRILHLLLTELEQPDPRIAALEAEITRLQARLAALEGNEDG